MSHDIADTSRATWWVTLGSPVRVGSVARSREESSRSARMSVPAVGDDVNALVVHHTTTRRRAVFSAETDVMARTR